MPPQTRKSKQHKPSAPTLERVNNMPTRLSDGLTEHLNHIETLANADIPAPKAWVALHDRFTTYRQLPTPAADRLCAAILEGADNDRLIELHALALAETADPPAHAKVDNAVAVAVERRLLDLYAPAAQSNYTKAANQFDSLATQFTNAVGVVDPETPADSIVRAPEKQQAWLDGQTFGHELSEYVGVLVAAAALAGTHVGTINRRRPFGLVRQHRRML